MDLCSGSSNTVVVLMFCHGEERVEPEGKALK